MKVIMDLVHSHAVKNELEGLGNFDGTPYQYFHDGARREHPAWDSLCFNYGKNEVLHFLLSNCKFWIDEYDFDGFRFDGVTSMIYRSHDSLRLSRTAVSASTIVWRWVSPISGSSISRRSRTRTGKPDTSSMR